MEGRDRETGDEGGETHVDERNAGQRDVRNENRSPLLLSRHSPLRHSSCIKLSIETCPARASLSLD